MKRAFVSSRFFLFIALVVLWSAELFLVQECTLVVNYTYPDSKWLLSRCFRFVFNVLFCTFCVGLFRRWLLYAVFVLNMIGATGLIVYTSYFERSLSLYTILYQAGEGLGVAGFIVNLFSWYSLAGLLVVLVVKVALNEKRRTCPGRVVLEYRLAIVSLLAYLLLGFTVNKYVDPLRKFETFGSVGRMGVTYGYIPAWIGELWYLDNGKLIERAVEYARDQQCDRLTPIEYPLQFDSDIVVIQMESVEFAVLDYIDAERPVMPFLNRLKDSAFFYKMQAIHINGSSDADFVMLTGLMPSPDVVTYKIKNYPYSQIETLGRLARQRGYVSTAFHGASGSFFDRRPAFQRMGLDSFLFKEEMVAHHGLTSDSWGVKDHDVFSLSLHILAKNKGVPQLHFIITLTSHGPWIYLSPDERQLYGQPKDIRENYLNSMRYLDSALEQYISRLPAGTTVVLYGDHESMIPYTSLNKAPAGDEWVPFFIYKVGSDISGMQVTRDQPIAHSGELNLLDAVNFIRACIRR
jgi:hypothetical protein